MVSGQYLANPSFEGPSAMHIAPPGWAPCDEKSTPDTQPGQWGNTMGASNGKSYLSMVTRGNWGPNANTTEDVEAALLEPLLAGNCYLLEIDLATCEDCGHAGDIGWISYAAPAILNIWGGYSTCSRDVLLATSVPVTNFSWRSFNFTLHPLKGDIRYLILEVDYASLPEYFGSLMLDNIRINTLETSVTRLDQVVNEEDRVKLVASDGISWEWSPSEGLSCFDCQSPWAQVTHSTSFRVRIRDSLICPRIEVFNLWMESYVFVPNAFRPGTEGVNAVFMPIFRGNLIDLDFRIFNRLGEEVYRSSKQGEGWDGQVSGQAAQAGIYPWLLEYRVYESKGMLPYRKTGYVYLLR